MNKPMEKMKKSDIAREMFATGYSCSQSVFIPFAKGFDIDIDTALKVSGSFGGGIVGSGKTCGVISGAMFAIGLKFGNSHPEDTEAKELCYQKGQLFLEKFKELNDGKTDCNDLIGYKRNDPKEHEKAKELGLYKERCPNFVEDAVKILEDILES